MVSKVIQDPICPTSRHPTRVAFLNLPDVITHINGFMADIRLHTTPMIERDIGRLLEEEEAAADGSSGGRSGEAEEVTEDAR